MVASTNKLGDLHGRLADAMSDALDAEVKRIKFTDALYEVDLAELDEETAKHISQAITLAPAARVDNGLLKTVSSFLKENNITADLGGEDGEDEVTKKLDALKAARRVASTPLDALN